MQETHWLAFAMVSLGLAIVPGPNMAYLVSRSVCQGRMAGLISLSGVALGFFVYALLTALGLSAILASAPFVYDLLRIGGAAYLAWLAWQVLRPGGRSPFELTAVAADPPRRLFLMGLLTNLLNPKAAALYISLLPQFLGHDGSSVFRNTISLGVLQIAISVATNTAVILAAGSIAGLLKGRPLWITVQRWFMGSLLTGLAINMLIGKRT